VIGTAPGLRLKPRGLNDTIALAGKPRVGGAVNETRENLPKREIMRPETAEFRRHHFPHWWASQIDGGVEHRSRLDEVHLLNEARAALGRE
jgi:hypothetical protein